MDELGEKIRKAMQAAGIDKAELARRCEVTPQAVHGWITTNRIRKGTLLKVAQITGQPIEWFISEDLENVNMPTQSAGIFSHQIPIVGHAIASPTHDGYFDDMGMTPGARDGFVFWHTRDSSAYALRVKGDSMQPRIRPGEIIVVEPTRSVSPGDDVLVKCLDGRRMVKQLLFRRRGEITLGSINSSHQQMTLAEDDIEAMHYIAGIMPNGNALED